MATTGTVDQMRTPFDDDRFLAPKLRDQTTRYGASLAGAMFTSRIKAFEAWKPLPANRDLRAWTTILR